MVEIAGRHVLVLGGAGMVGEAVCRELVAHKPAMITIAARRAGRAARTVERIRHDHPAFAGVLVAAHGDVFLRAAWQESDAADRDRLFDDPRTRERAIDDMLAPLDDDMLQASLLYRLITGKARGMEGRPADIIIDCMNTATAVSYQNVFAQARHVAAMATRAEDVAAMAPPVENAATMAARAEDAAGLKKEVDRLILSLSVPQLVRHVQILHASMQLAGTRAYLKIGTTGTGGMGFNIPYTHGEEKPSRMLLAKSALAGAQTMLTALLARTPGGPELVREIKPAALIGWRAIGHGPIVRRGVAIEIVDCALADAVDPDDPASLVPAGEFGARLGGGLEGVFIDTGENGLFSADEFAAITTPGQMQMITPEEIARHVVIELSGGATGRDVVGALAGSLSGPGYRAGCLRDSAIARLRELEARHGRAVAFEHLGPPRLSKLLFEAELLARIHREPVSFMEAEPSMIARELERLIAGDADLRRRILSIGLAVLLGDGRRLLRGPMLKAVDADEGWVDLRPDNIARWQSRLLAFRSGEDELGGRTGSFDGMEKCLAAAGFPAPGDLAGWIFNTEEGGRRIDL